MPNNKNVLSKLKSKAKEIPFKKGITSDKLVVNDKQTLKQSDALQKLKLSLNTNIVKPREESILKTREEKFTKYGTYNEAGKRVKTLTPYDRLGYNATNLVKNLKEKKYSNSLKDAGKGFLNSVDIVLEPIAQQGAKAIGLVSQSAGSIAKNMTSLDETISRDYFNKDQQKILDDIITKHPKGRSPINRTEYGSEYGFKKDKSTLEQLKNKIFDNKQQLTNVLGNARLDKDDKNSTISDVYNFDKEGNSSEFLDNAKTKRNPYYKSNDDKNNMSILERAGRMLKDKLNGSPLDRAIANNLRSVGAKVNYKKNN